jgi:hypothetical protein
MGLIQGNVRSIATFSPCSRVGFRSNQINPSITHYNLNLPVPLVGFILLDRDFQSRAVQQQRKEIKNSEKVEKKP